MKDKNCCILIKHNSGYDIKIHLSNFPIVICCVFDLPPLISPTRNYYMNALKGHV